MFNVDKKTPRHHGGRCLIRPFLPNDIEDFFDFARLPEVSRYMNWHPHATVLDTKKFLTAVIDSQDEDIESPWAIVSSSDHVCCGFVGYSHFSADHRRADLVVALHPKYAGCGIAREACEYLLKHAKMLGLQRIQAVVEVDNIASCKLMSRLGATREAFMRRYLVAKNGSADAYLYAFYLP